MRVTFVLPAVDMSGGVRVVSIYAERLRQRGHQVAAVSTLPTPPTLREIAGSVLRGRGWPRAPKSGPSHFDGLAVAHRRLNHAGPVTDKDVPDADVVVATWWETARWIHELSPAKGAKVHFVQDYEFWGGTPEELEATYRLPNAKIVIVGWLRDMMDKKFNQSPLALVPNSVDTDKFHAPPRGKQPTPTVGMTYALKQNKGCDISLQAYERALKHVPSLHLVSMGNDRISDRLPLPKNAEFTFQARDHKLREIYARCDAWLFGTRQEGFGLPILEAMACRTPVIGTPGGAAPDILAKGGGILVPAENPPAMAEAIVKVCAMTEEEWRKLSDSALAVATGYTWEDATDLFEKALEQVSKH